MNKQILIVEDDLDDREILEESIGKADSSMQLKFTENGADALEYLCDLKNNKLPLPRLIILDLNMPYIDGLQTYKRLHADDVLNNIPVAVFTSSQNPNDKELFERMGIAFITKPYSLDKMNDIVRRMLLIAANQPGK